MHSAWVVLVSFSYAAILFGIAWVGDKYHERIQTPPIRSVIYGLALAVYCSSWTFYGAVGSAVRYGWGYLPIYLGPFLMIIFGWRIIERLSLVVQSQNIVSISDFMSSRFGRSQRLAALVALMAVISCIPYLALQYKAVSLSITALTGSDFKGNVLRDPTLYIAFIMAVFSILFGARKVDATEHRPGLMLAIAFESLVKLIAFIAVGLFAFVLINDTQLHPQKALQTLMDNTPPVGFLGQVLLAFTAIILLPRQFHVAIMECSDVRDVRRARVLFGIYLILVSFMAIPIASVGMDLFGRDGDIAADIFVLALPFHEGNTWLALAAYLGGFSAATGMVVVTSVALSIMVSNDLLMPLWLRRDDSSHNKDNISETMLWVRRAVIMLVAATAYGYYYSTASERALSAYGLITFAAVIQFAPGVFAGLYWQGASRRGVEVGLLLGFLVWLYTLFLPTLTESGWLSDYWVQNGPLDISWLKPSNLFGLFNSDPLTHGTFWSLAINITAMLWISWHRPPSLSDRLMAKPFLDPYDQRPTLAQRLDSSHILVKDLMTLAIRIVGENRARLAFSEHAHKQNIKLHPQLAADSSWLQLTELLLAGAVGAASARLVITSALRGSGLEVDTVVSLLDETGQELRFNRDILLTTIENMEQGVSVVDADMCLVAWNHSYEKLFNYPPGMLRVGRHIAELIRYNAEQGKIPSTKGNLDIDTAIERRIGFMRAGTSHTMQRTMNNDRVIELKGRPLPGGGYVTSYNDVTEYKRVEGKLREINEHLEQRVAERTHEAELAQVSRTRFLTAVSHDVLQPMNAARLFASALFGSRDNEEIKDLSLKIDTSLQAAEELLDGLLDISQLDAGALTPEIKAFDGRALLEDLIQQYKPVADRRNLGLRFYMPPMTLYSDPRLLRRVLQNFISNAMRYTHAGRIVIAARRRGNKVVLQVWDTGQGIPPRHLHHIYTEFHRVEQEFDWGERGMGLGLSICQRIATLLEHSLDASSELGKGSVFSITVPLATDQQIPKRTKRKSPIKSSTLEGMRILCLDNDVDILHGMTTLLGQWGADVITATTVDDALQKMGKEPHVLLVDYHLYDRLNGLDSLDLLRENARHIPGALLTADGSKELKEAARQRGYLVITKPVRPASLRSFLTAHYKGK